MIATYGYVLADDDFYLPLSAVAKVGRGFTPSNAPDGWTATDHGVWRSGGSTTRPCRRRGGRFTSHRNSIRRSTSWTQSPRRAFPRV